MRSELRLKPVRWITGSLKDLRGLSQSVQDSIGYALYLAQRGEMSPDAKSLKGFGGRSVLEIVENDEGGTYRAVYTVRFQQAVYVLHVFQKKSKKGISTPKSDISLIRERLKLAEEDYLEWIADQGGAR